MTKTILDDHQEKEDLFYFKSGSSATMKFIRSGDGRLSAIERTPGDDGYSEEEINQLRNSYLHTCR